MPFPVGRTHELFELGKFHQQPTIAKTSVDARKARVGCLRKILLNSWSYGARWVADHLFDSMSSVVGDRAVAQADHSLPRCDGSNWCLCCQKSRHNSRSNLNHRHSLRSGKIQALWHTGLTWHRWHLSEQSQIGQNSSPLTHWANIASMAFIGTVSDRAKFKPFDTPIPPVFRCLWR